MREATISTETKKPDSPPQRPASLSVLITGASGFIGQEVLRALVQRKKSLRRVTALDIRRAEPPLAGIEWKIMDIRDPALSAWMQQARFDVVVHLVAILDPGANRALAHAVEVGGTENLLRACVAGGVRKIIVSSSGAAYGYHADNPPALREEHPLRGNAEFAYSAHKREIEEMLAEYRKAHPELQQLIFRLCTVLGTGVRNPITNLFEKKVIFGLAGGDIPFSLIWHRDVAECMVRGVLGEQTGIYNVAADGVVTLREMARMLGKPYLPLPPALVAAGLRLLRGTRLTRYGPEQVNFLRYRPVLDNEKLKRNFGFFPRLTAQQVFEKYVASLRGGRREKS